MSYDKWRARLRKEKVVTYLTPDADDEGYYRKPSTRRLPNGRNEILGWTPVAYFLDPFVPDVLRGVIGDRDMTEQEVASEELWSWVVANPVEYETYKAVAEEGKPWPDSPEVQLAQLNGVESIPAANREVSRNDNRPEEPELAPELVAKQAIDNAIGLTKDLKVTNAEEASLAAGIMNRLAELRLKADKDGKAVYEPPFRLYKAAYAVWNPMVKEAEAAEKKVNRLLLTWQESERKRVAAEAAEEAAKAAKAAKELEEANQRAADRAIANGEAEAPPVVEEPAPPPPPKVTPIKPTYGSRARGGTMQTFVDVVDFDLVYAHFKEQDAVKAVLRTLATAAIKAGYTVPGTTKREGLI